VRGGGGLEVKGIDAGGDGPDCIRTIYRMEEVCGNTM
jgi:hypothetical protein